MRSLRIPMLAAMLFILASSLSAGPVRASEDWSTLKNPAVHDTRPQTLDISLILGFLFGSYSHFGVAGWYGYPIVPDGFIPKLNDALFIEAGAAVERYSFSIAACGESWWRVSPMGGVRYQMYLTDEWTVFATAKLGYGIGFASAADCAVINGTTSQVVWDSSVGAYWNFSPNWHLRLEMGYFGVNPGIGMQL